MSEIYSVLEDICISEDKNEYHNKTVEVYRMLKEHPEVLKEIFDKYYAGIEMNLRIVHYSGCSTYVFPKITVWSTIEFTQTIMGYSYTIGRIVIYIDLDCKITIENTYGLRNTFKASEELSKIILYIINKYKIPLDGEINSKFLRMVGGSNE